MTKVKSITLFVNDRHLAKLTAESNPNLYLQSHHLEFLIEKTDSFGNFDFMSLIRINNIESVCWKLKLL